MYQGAIAQGVPMQPAYQPAQDSPMQPAYQQPAYSAGADSSVA